MELCQPDLVQLNGHGESQFGDQHANDVEQEDAIDLGTSHNNH